LIFTRKSIADELHLLLAPLSSTGVTVRTQIAEGNTAVVRRATCPVVTIRSESPGGQMKAVRFHACGQPLQA
jgi:hypothetical protein